MRQLFRFHDHVTTASAVLSVACVGVICFSYCYEVVSRYFFNAPTSWVAAVTVYLLLASVMLMAPHVTRLRGHVTITFVLERVGPGLSRRLHAACIALSAIVCLLSVWFTGTETVRQYEADTTMMDSLLLTPEMGAVGADRLRIPRLRASISCGRSRPPSRARSPHRRARGGLRSGMPWYETLTLGFALMIGLIFTGVPIFVAFVIINAFGILWAFGSAAFGMYSNSLLSTLTNEVAGDGAAVPADGRDAVPFGRDRAPLQRARQADRQHAHPPLSPRHRARHRPWHAVRARPWPTPPCSVARFIRGWSSAATTGSCRQG